MSRAASLLLLSLLSVILALANTPSKPDGQALFRANCAFCHGTDARGGRGANLLGELNHGATRKDLERTIREGIPGSEMTGFDFEPEEIKELVSYLTSLRRGPASPGGRVEGNAAAGKAVYARHGCSSCHQIGSEGGVLGPDLSHAGASRSAAYLRESIVNPSADIRDDYRAVRVVMRDGTAVTGIRINEDTFSVQLRLPDQKFHSYDKQELREVSYPEKSMMPAYSLPEEDLRNLVAYLTTLRAEPAAAAASGNTERDIR